MSERLDIRHLRQFLAVCDAESMTSAGERRGVTTAAVSKAVTALEKDLGVPLFRRRSAGLTLTPAGARLRRRARELLDQHEQILSDMSAFKDEHIPRLRLHTLDSVAAFLWPTIHAELEGRVGQLTLDSATIASPTDDLLRGKFDIAITAEEVSELPGVEAHPVLEEPLVLVCPATVPPSERTLENLARHLPLIRFAKVRHMDALVEAHLAEQDVEPKAVLQCSTAAPLLAMVRHGLGFALTTPLTVSFMRPSATEIALVPLPARSVVRRISLVALRGEFDDIPSRLAQACRRGLRKEARPLISEFSDEIARQIWPDRLVRPRSDCTSP